MVLLDFIMTQKNKQIDYLAVLTTISLDDPGRGVMAAP